MLAGIAGIAGFVGAETSSTNDDILFYAASPTSNVFDITGLDLSSYQRVILYLDEVEVDTEDTDILVEYYISGVLQTSGYRYAGRVDPSGFSFFGEASNSASAFALSLLADAGANPSFRAEVEIATGGAYKVATAETQYMASGGTVSRGTKSGLLENAGTLDGIKISASGGLITAGRALLLAMKTS